MIYAINPISQTNTAFNHLSESDALGFTLACNTSHTLPQRGPMGAVLSVLLRRITDLRIHPPPSPSHAPTR
jgi:hypothetical protein